MNAALKSELDTLFAALRSEGTPAELETSVNDIDAFRDATTPQARTWPWTRDHQRPRCADR